MSEEIKTDKLEAITKPAIMETHGRDESAGTQPTNLEQVWGYNELSKFGTNDEAVYQKQLDEMLRIDLETHARRHNVIIVESTARLREKLLNNFKTYVSLLHKPADKKKSQYKPDAAALKVLSEGR